VFGVPSRLVSTADSTNIGAWSYETALVRLRAWCLSVVPGLGIYTMSYYAWCHRLTVLQGGASSSSPESGVSIAAQQRRAFALGVFDVLPNLTVVRRVTTRHRLDFALGA